MNKIILLNACLLTMSIGCSETPGDVVAQYKDHSLTQTGLLSLMPQDYSPSDSADIANQIIQHWIELEWWKDQTADAEWTEENEAQLEEYKQVLLFQNWKNQYISDQLDTVITAEQIQQWRISSGDSLNKFSTAQIQEVILQSRKNNMITEYMKQSLKEAESSGVIKKGPVQP